MIQGSAGSTKERRFPGKVVCSMASPSPLSICLTNMVIVFAVLVFLAFVIQLIHIVDPTKKK
jgi:multisubunit Na+/H+ antiporter MnhC subunit